MASEILYYLDADALAQTLGRLEARMAPGGRLVCVHWRPAGPERPADRARRSTTRLRRAAVAARLRAERRPEYLLDVLERR